MKLSKKKQKSRKGCFIAVIFVLLIVGASVFFIGRISSNKNTNIVAVAEETLYPIEYQSNVEYWAKENSIDPYLVYAIIRTESGFNPDAESNVGARGLMQMTDETFVWIKGKIAPNEDLTFDDLYDPDVNIRFCSYYFALCLARYNNDISTAAAAYHSGWGTVDNLLEDAENTSDGKVLTQFSYTNMNHYVKKINSSYAKYKSLYAS